MSSIEEKIWNYIDGSCTPEEQTAIGQLIEHNEAYRRKYEELVQLNAEFSAVELDEPPMAFTYNVMETIRTEYAQQPLKAAINKRIIKGIGLFFIITISAILIFAMANIRWSASAVDNHTTTDWLPKLKGLLSGPAMQVFLFFDVVLGLYLLDGYLRRKRDNRMIENVPIGGQQKR